MASTFLPEKVRHLRCRNIKYIYKYECLNSYYSYFSPEYLEAAFPALCRALGLLPVAAQARLAKVWASFGVGRLTEMLHMLQQLITVRIINHEGRWGRGLQLNDDEAISGACGVMKVNGHLLSSSISWVPPLSGCLVVYNLARGVKQTSKVNVLCMVMCPLKNL